jgi:fatty acid-binding protein DegV
MCPDADSGLDEDAAFAQLETRGKAAASSSPWATRNYLVHGGRVGKVLRLAGSTLQIRPIITQRRGELSLRRGHRRNLSKKKVLEKALSYLKKLVDLSANRFCVVHAGIRPRGRLSGELCGSAQGAGLYRQGHPGADRPPSACKPPPPHLTVPEKI